MQCHCGSTAQYVLGRDGKPNFSCAQGRCKFWSVGPSSCEGYPRVVLNQPHPPAGTVIIRFEATLHPGELGLPGVMAMCEGEIPEGHAVRQLLQSDEFQGTWYPSRRAFLYILPRYAALLTQLQELSRNSHNVNNPCSFPLHIEPIPKFFFKCLNNANLLVKSHVSDLPDNEDFVYQKLHNFQKEGVHFLLQHGGRGMIADEMGLGKTVQAIAAAHYYREEWPLLIVCPMSLMENWAKEVNRFCSIPFSRIMLIQGKKTSKRSGSEEAGECVKDVVIASYHSLQEVPQDLASGFRVLIFDESHYIKTPNSKRTKYALELCSKANRVILLSGTPALSRPMELYTQLRAIAPPSATPILPSTSQFAARYCNAHICSRGTIFTVNTDGHSHTDELHLLLQHFMIRRRKSELGEGALPSKSRRLVYITVEEKGKARLEKQVSALRKSIESQPSSIGEQGWAPKTQNVFELKMATAQAKIPGIINYVATTVEKHRLSKEKLILFGHHQCMMDALKEAVEKAGKNHPVDFILISGDTPSNQREVLAEHFRSDPNCLVAILSMQSSGVGHNFTCASTVIFSELDWNPSMHLQCEDRVHRIGQSRSCVIQYLLAEGTADAVLWPLLNSKLSVTTAVLCGTSDNGNDCTSATGKLDVDAAERVVISSQRTIDEFLPRRSTDSSGDRPRAAKESPRRVSSLDGNAAQSLEIEKSDVHSAGVVSFASMANDKTWRETAFSPPIPGVPRSQKTTRGALPNEVAAPRSAHASPRNAPNATFIPTLVGAPCVPSHGSSPLMGRRTTFVLKSHGANASPANASGSSDALLHGEESQIHPVSEIKVSSHLAADSCSDNDPEAGQKRKRDHHEASSGLRSHGIDSRSPLRVHNDVPLGSASRDLAGETTLSERKTAPAILRPSNGSSVIPSERAPIVSGVAFPHSGSGEFLESQIQEAQSLLFSQRDDSQKGRTSQVSVNICQPSFKENVNRRSLTPEFTQPRKRTLVRAYTSPQPLPSTAPGKTVSDITPSSPTAPQLRCSHNSIDLSNDSGVNLPLTGDQKTSTCAITAPFTDLPKDSEALKGEGEGLSAALPSSCVEIPLQLLLKPVCHSSSDMTANYGLPARKTFILRHNTKQSIKTRLLAKVAITLSGMLASEGVDNSLLRSGRTEFYREIHFEKYKKPHVIEYPKHAVVLNPQHTQNVKKVFASSSSSLGWEREDPLKRQHHVDEDDPQFMEPSLFICKDDELSRVMHLQWKEIGPVGLGLINMGNTCFANAVLQAIAYTPALAQYFAFQFRNPDARIGAPYDFAFALGETIRKLHLSRDKGKSNQGSFQSGAYKPALIMNQLRHLSSHFQLGKQCDAHEFAMQLLFAAQKSFLFHRVGTTKLPMHIATTTPLLRICGGFLRSQVSWNREDEIQQLLRKGKHQEAGDLRLEGNGRKGEKLFSNTYDPVTILSVELVGTSLENCLANFFKKEELDGRCYQSPRGVGVRAEKQFTFHVLPNVLIVQIKRFLSCGSKARKYIRYPLELDLQPYCSPTTREARSPQRYYLSAVCIHQGHTINCGHYYSVVKARNGTWYECDDSSVRLISEEKALNKEAYMLFYSKKDEEGHINDPKTSKRCLNELHPPQRLSHPSPKRLSPPEISSRSQVFDYPSSDLHSTYPFVHDLSNLSNALYTDEKELGKVISEEELAVLKKKRSSKHSKEHCEEEAQPHLSFEQHEHPSSYFSGSKVSVEERPYLPLLHQDGSKDEEAQHNQMEENFCTVGKKMTKKLLGSQSLIVKKISHDPVKKGSKVYNGESFRPREITAVHRDSALPKFQQKIRDPLWEISMDQGRVKKIKSHRLNELEDGQLGQKRNPFQEETEKRFKRKYEANK